MPEDLIEECEEQLAALLTRHVDVHGVPRDRDGWLVMARELLACEEAFDVFSMAGKPRYS